MYLDKNNLFGCAKSKFQWVDLSGWILQNLT